MPRTFLWLLLAAEFPKNHCSMRDTVSGSTESWTAVASPPATLLLRQHHGAFGESRAGAKGRANLGLNAISLWQQHYSGKKRTHTPEIRDISTKNNKKNQPSSTTVANHFPLHFLIALLPHKDNKDSLIWLRILEKRGGSGLFIKHLAKGGKTTDLVLFIENVP